MAVRNCVEIGENLQKIVKRLMANDNLVNLLYYTDKDPLNQPHLTEQEKKDKIGFYKLSVSNADLKYGFTSLNWITKVQVGSGF